MQLSPRRQLAWKEKHNRPLLLQGLRHKNDGRRPSKGNAPRRSIPLGKGGQRPCNKYHNGNCTNPLCNCWQPLVCQNYKSESGCKFGEKYEFRHTEVDSQPNKKPKTGGRGLRCLIEEFEAIGLRIPGFRVTDIHKHKAKDKATFYSPSEVWSLPAPSSTKPEERTFETDSGASLHMPSRKDLNSAEQDTIRVSRNPTTVITAN